MQKVTQLTDKYDGLKTLKNQMSLLSSVSAIPLRTVWDKLREQARKAFYNNIQLAWISMDIMLNIHRGASHLWTNKHRIIQSIACILNQVIKKTELQTFFYLPTRNEYKILYLSFTSKLVPVKILKSRTKWEIQNIRIQRIFRQKNRPLKFRKKLMNTKTSYLYDPPTNLDKIQTAAQDKQVSLGGGHPVCLDETQMETSVPLRDIVHEITHLV